MARRLDTLDEDDAGRLLGSGVSRDTYVWSEDKVVKLANSDRGVEKNRKEMTVTNDVDDKAPIAEAIKISSDGRVLIAERSNTGRPALPRDVSKVRTIMLKRYDWYISDLTTENVGFQNGGPVAIDYGSARRQRVSEMDPTERRIHGIR